MFEIEFSDEIKAAAPGLRVIAIEARVANGPTSDTLWEAVESEAMNIQGSTPIEAVNKRGSIAATRVAYKALGKDPNRYRPSAEALCRRAVNGKGLYRLTMLVDFINLLSMRTGHSIGGFDADKIKGNSLVLGRGRAGECFNAIGRGQLNIDGLPVYRDAVGGIGTPTSDEERTKLTPPTQRLLMLINVYDADEDIESLTDLAISLLNQYCTPKSLDYRLFAVK